MVAAALTIAYAVGVLTGLVLAYNDEVRRGRRGPRV